MDRQTRENYGGFTFMEMLIVLAIVTLMSTVAVPNFLVARSRSAAVDTSDRVKGSTLSTALQFYGIETEEHDAREVVLPSLVPDVFATDPPLAAITPASLGLNNMDLWGQKTRALLYFNGIRWMVVSESPDRLTARPLFQSDDTPVEGLDLLISPPIDATVIAEGVALPAE